MKAGYSTNNLKNLRSCIRKGGVAFLICILSLFIPGTESDASTYDTNKVVRVGFFEFEGYHELDEQSKRSGYGYEYLHEMAKYTGWVFEYVDGTWDECQEMLKNGKIDLLTSAQYSEERDEVFDFSANSMGSSYAQLTVADGNTTFGRNDFTTFDGMKIGLLKGNSRNDKLAEFSIEKKFTYTPIIYDTQEDLDKGLKTGAVDAVLTSSLRKLDNERIIAQFSPSPFYAIVREGNDKLLDEIDAALESIEMNTPAFRYNLYEEYYGGDKTDTFILSREEEEYLETRPTIRAVIRPGVAPISYWENGSFQGISADIMEYLLADLNIKVEYICPDTLKESYEMLENGSADISCMFESDYNLAEQYDTRITAPYLKANYSIISRQQSGNNPQTAQKFAIPDGGLIGSRYAQSHYPNAVYVPVASNYAAIEAVSKGQADIAIVNIYSAEKALLNFPNLRASFISDDDQQFSVGVSQLVDTRLYSILDKKINAMNSQVFNDILYEHTAFQQVSISLTDYFRQHPLQILLFSLLFFLIIIGILFYIMLNNRNHAKKIYSLAYADGLTKLWNTNGFHLQGNLMLEKNIEDTFAVLAIDLAKFSEVNENYGHDTGDKIIHAMGNILYRFNNDKTVAAHTDADHFLLLLSYQNKEDLYASATAIARVLTTYNIDDLNLLFQVNMGVGFIKRGEESLFHAIDLACTARNKCDANHPIMYMDETLQSSLLREKEIQNHVEAALEQGEFQVFFQPKVNMTNETIFGAEALIRWNHSTLGFLSPGEFVPLLEQSGIITEVDFFVLEQVCKLMRRWLDRGQKSVVISVNQSRAHFVKKNYIERLQNMIIQYNIPPGHIELEITETLFGQEAISDTMIKKIKSIGFLTSIDDFGSGYSSLYLLHQISVDVLKIDKGLLDEGDKHEKVRNIIRRIVQIAADIDVEVICEGVETKEQVDFLLGINCMYAQGFFYSKPLQQQEFEALIQKDRIFD